MGKNKDSDKKQPRSRYIDFTQRDDLMNQIRVQLFNTVELFSPYGDYKPYLRSHHSYINANSQLVLKPDTPSSDYISNSNLEISLDNILFVIKPRFDIESDNNCCICISEPSPPVITSCGHIFCWPCIVSCHTQNGYERYCKCPICSINIDISQVKIVLWKFCENPAIGSTVSFKLFKRDPKNCYILEKDSFNYIPPSIPSNFVEIFPGSFFLLMSSEDDLTNTYNHNRILESSSNEDETIKILLGVKECLVTMLKNEDDEKRISSIEKIIRLQSNLIDETIDGFNDTNSQEVICGNNHTLFYQFTNGDHVYLHPSNVQQLCQEHLKLRNINLDNAPLVVKGTVLNTSKLIVTNDTHIRYKFLSHVSPKTEVTFCMIKMTSPDLPQLNSTSETDFNQISSEDNNEIDLNYSADDKKKSVEFEIPCIDIHDRFDFPGITSDDFLQFKDSGSTSSWDLDPLFTNTRTSARCLGLESEDYVTLLRNYFTNRLTNDIPFCNEFNLVNPFNNMTISNRECHQSKKTSKRKKRRSSKNSP